VLHYNRSRLVRFVARHRDLGTPTAGTIDEATFIDGEPGLVKQRFGTDVPRGAPFFVRGWAVDLGRRDLPWDLTVEIDGRPFPARIARGDSRPDIVNSLRTSAVLGSGFRAYIDTRGLTVGPHDLNVRAVVGRRGSAYAKLGRPRRLFIHDRYPSVFAPPKILRARTPWFVLDPLGEIATGDVLSVTGWALDARGSALRAVAVRIDDDPWNAGWVGIERPERRAKHVPPRFARGGFSVRVRLDTVAPGTHVLEFAGKTAAGTWIALGSREHLVVTHPPEIRSPWLRPLLSQGEAVITSVDGIGDACWSTHRLAASQACTVAGVLRRPTPPGTPVTLVVCESEGERRFPAWSAPTSNPNALMFGACIPAGVLAQGSHELFVDAPDLAGRCSGRIDTGCRLLVGAAAASAGRR
jgi:hypothetical protein